MEKYFAIRRAKPVPETPKNYLRAVWIVKEMKTEAEKSTFQEKASRDTLMSPRQASTWLFTRNFKNSELAEWMPAQKSLNQVSEWAIRNKTARHPGGCPGQKQQSRPEQFKITLMPQ